MAKRGRSLQAACNDFEEALVLYYYGDCSETERDGIQEHLKECLPCRRFLEELHAFLPLMAKPKELPQSFWDRYYRELQEKLMGMDEAEPWRSRLWSFLRPWTVPALGTAVIVVLALTFTLNKGIWLPQERSTEEASHQEIGAVAKNVEFFANMDFLESLDLLEALEESKAVQGSARKL